MRLSYADAHGLWLKIQKLSELQKHPLPAEDSVLVTWASVCLAPIYLLTSSFQDQPEVLVQGSKGIYIDVSLTHLQVRQLDRLFIQHVLDDTYKAVRQPDSEESQIKRTPTDEKASVSGQQQESVEQQSNERQVIEDEHNARSKRTRSRPKASSVSSRIRGSTKD